MGRRKIEIKAIKDDRNRSVTFLKRKGGLFKKAHELSVLCSVDVAVFIFGTNKKLYEYSSGDMRELMARYQFHSVQGGALEHKGPADFGGEEEDDEDENGTPPHDHMLPHHYQGQQPFPHHMRHHTPSASPPIPNGVVFPAHAHAVQRGHTPQPNGSRPGSRNDMRRMSLMNQPLPPQGSPQVNGFAFVPQPSIYQPNAVTMAPHMPPQMAPQYPYPPPQPHPHPHQMPQYIEDQRRAATMPASFAPQAPPQQAPMPVPVPVPVAVPVPVQRHSVSVSPPQQHVHQVPQLPPQPAPHSSPPQPHHHQILESPNVKFESPQQMDPPAQQHEAMPLPSLPPPPPPQAPTEPKGELAPPPQPRMSKLSLLDTAIKKLPRQKQHSIFTPIDENRSILSQHLAAFHGEQPKAKFSPPTHQRSSSLDEGASNASDSRSNDLTASPPLLKRAGPSPRPRHSVPTIPTIPETTFTPPSRSNSLRVGGPSRPRLKVQIPDEQSDDASASATGESSSPRGGQSTDATSQSTQKEGPSSNLVLPPPSPSATTLLSAGATGPPNPFAPKRPPQIQVTAGLNIDTPVSALPSRFLHNEFLPSPSSFYPEWNFRGGDSNTLPSPLNFATPVVGSGPSFLRDEGGLLGTKRKSPDHLSVHGHLSDNPLEAGNEPKRVKVDS